MEILQGAPLSCAFKGRLQYVSCSLEPTQSLAAGIYNPYVTALHPTPTPRIPTHWNDPPHLHYQLNGEEAKELLHYVELFLVSFFLKYCP